MLRRTWSIRRPQTYSLTRRVDPGTAMQREKGMIRCQVTLLDDRVFTCDMDKNHQGESLLHEVAKHLDLLEKDYFGLAYNDEGMMKWVEAGKQLKKQFKGSHLLALQFRVKFYVPDPSHLQEELTRYLFYLQIKNDIFSGRLPCSFESAALLGSYMVQAELGDYSPRKHQQGYVSELQLFPGQTEDLEEKIAEFHREHIGKTTQEAEFLLLANARRLEFYGVELFAAKDHHGIDLSLGITTDGIAVFKSRTIITTFPWVNIRKITFKRRRFFIELRPDQDTGEQNAVGFHMDSYDGCKQLWKDCIDYHAFFRTAESAAKGFMKRSKKRFGRTERQVMDESKPLALKRSASVRIKRTLTKRQPRRTIGTNLGVQGSGGASMGGIPRRNHSFNMYDVTQKPQVTIRANGYRDMSDEPEDHFDDYPPLSLSQQAMTVSDDMTGQFTLAALEEEQYPATHRRVSDLEQGPTDYYDDQVKQEEEIGNVCMDDLASEGLLLIRLEADERGRYGFNVKGGVDQKMPVLVSKVSPQSPAEKSNPPLEEGDQLLYINSKPVSHARHEEVITMIRASRDKTPMELILIVKPKDLSRTNPIVRTQTTESATSDPGQLLRQSLTYLKESLSNSMGLLQFDRLYRRKPGMAAIASKLPQNLVKNRYRDISAYDATRVHLREGPDYINANFVNLEVETTGQIVSYIASQGPMQHTCKDFWQMVWEQSCELVIMLTEVVENGKVRCCQYWPEKGSTKDYGKFQVMTHLEQVDRVYITRRFKLRNNLTGEEHTVTQMQYIDWPDHGIPGSKVDFLRFVQAVKKLRESIEGPITAHCSAGIGRTGVFMLMETALCKMEVLEPIYPLEIVRAMRDQRGMLVQTPIQYQFVCESILKAYEDDYVEIELPHLSTSSLNFR